MKLTVNESGRKRILCEDFTVSVERVDSSMRAKFSLTWDIAYLSLPAESEIVVEVSSRGNQTRLNIGSLGTGVGVHAWVADILEESPTFRIDFFVTHVDGSINRIVAASTTVRVDLNLHATASTSFLPVKLVTDLSVLWRVDYSTGQPVLYVSNKNPGLVTQEWFRLAVLPQLVRDVFVMLVSGLEVFDEEPKAAWTNFFASYGVRDIFLESDYSKGDSVQTDDLSEIMQEADRVCAAFTSRHDLLTLSSTSLLGDQ